MERAHFCSCSVFHNKNIFLTARKLNKNTSEINSRKAYNIRFDASSSPLSNGENCSSLSCFYQKLFKKILTSIHVTVTHANKTDLIEILL